jgi:hypothetical protein
MSEQPIKLFISHASEDKQPFVDQLYNALKGTSQFEVWYDTDSLHLGASITFEISDALNNCQYALVVLSPIYITKKWCKREYAAIVHLESDEKKIMLPIWHNITEGQVKGFDVSLMDRPALHSTRQIEDIVTAITAGTWTGQKARQLANPSLKERAVQVKNQIIKNQLCKSFEGVQLVNKSVAFIFDRFEQLIKELQDTLSIQTQRYDTPTHSFPWLEARGYKGACIVASGPHNANIEVAYVNKSGNRIADNRLYMEMFKWDYDFPSVQGKRKRKGPVIILAPDITANEVQWQNEYRDERYGPYFTSEQIAHEAVEYLLALISASNADAS